MNRRKITILTVASALVLTVALYVSLTLSSWSHRPPELSLPPEAQPSANATPDGSGDGPAGVEVTPAPTPKPLIKVEVTRENVQDVVRTLSRPAACSYAVSVTLFWENGSTTRRRTVAAKNGVSRVDAYDDAGNAEKHTITGAGVNYVWLPGSPVYEGVQGSATGDSAAQLPTYEMLLELPADAILDAAYEILDETIPCAYAEAKQPHTGYTARYWISLETGLLVRSEWSDGTKPVYAMILEDFSGEEPPDALFTLPGGQLISGAVA